MDKVGELRPIFEQENAAAREAYKREKAARQAKESAMKAASNVVKIPGST
jgi:hypothetical protein